MTARREHPRLLSASPSAGPCLVALTRRTFGLYRSFAPGVEPNLGSSHRASDLGRIRAWATRNYEGDHGSSCEQEMEDVIDGSERDGEFPF
jgi:hypothetical protein